MNTKKQQQQQQHRPKDERMQRQTGTPSTRHGPDTATPESEPKGSEHGQRRHGFDDRADK